MISKEIIELVIKRAKEENLSEKVICDQLSVNYKTLFYYKKKYNLSNYTRGCNPNSKKSLVGLFSYRRKCYELNDNFFTSFSPLSAYWAGFIAADGNISKTNVLTIGLAEKDRSHLEKFIRDIGYNRKLTYYTKSNKFRAVYTRLSSSIICYNLKEKYNITPRKSLTLLPPNIVDNYLLDCFIIGYIDGDGCISKFLYRKQDTISICILGTYQMITWIKDRFSTVLNKQLKGISRKKEHKNNTYSLTIGCKNARDLFLHYWNITSVPKLKRKWNSTVYNHCISYKKYRNLIKYKQIYDLLNSGENYYSIAKKFNVSYQSIYWYTKQKEYINKEWETEELDKGTVSMEDEQSIAVEE